MNNLTNEQLRQIIDGAPDGATKFAIYIDIYYFKPAIPNGLKLYSPFVDKWQWVHDCSMLRNLRDLSDLKEILALRERVESLENALEPFANYACGGECDCHNCVARDLLKQPPKESTNE